jgi:hypothetical protein
LTELLPGIDRRDTQTERSEGCRKYGLEMGSGAMIYIPSFIKIGSDIQKLIDGAYRHTDSMEMA